ncbi:hypothetical protein STCU_00981 [Strigomonas culicis]|uniref:GAF domain-containing protein n=1 Tax=Strigomonas culicis TaxID=28005 RepID=S9V466_9TRYP|nr:hypothetical protein STCU_00981 [Strigomonas culicis]|eukprot:EPY35693.1 hypothetical protein STCU_00981 [Strigomonas culicis]
MPFQLCASCRNSYPSDLVESASFTENVSKRVEAVNHLVHSVEGKSAIDVDRLQQLSLGLHDLCGAVHREFEELQKQIVSLQDQCNRKDKYMETSKAATADAQTALYRSSGGPMKGQQAPAEVSTYKPTFNGTVQPYQLKKMNTALELVSASIYRLLEGVAVQTRAETTLLWLRPTGFVAVELVAPFVVGRDVSQLMHSSPYRCPESSIPCAVASTGIAVNIKPREGVHDTRPSEQIPLLELVEKSNVAQLVVPVYVRGGELERQVLAVLHIIGSPRFPFPFHRRNEETVVQAAGLLTTMVASHYDVMISEWSNRFYDASLITSTAAYRGDLDLRADEKGLDDFQLPPTLMYRCVNERQDESDPREASKALRHAMLRSAAPMVPLVGVKDLHRHAMNMEANWSYAVERTTKLEGMLTTLKEDALQAELDELRAMRDKNAAAKTSKDSFFGPDMHRKSAANPTVSDSATTASKAEKEDLLVEDVDNLPLLLRREERVITR